MVVLVTTFLLTVIIDLTVAIEIGMVLAAFLFMRQMIMFSDVSILKRDIDDSGKEKNTNDIEILSIPSTVEVFEITGPLFFGAAHKFKAAMRFIENPPKILIIRMRQVPFIDAKKNLIEFQIVNGTIPHEITANFKATSIFLHPAVDGTGLIAGGSIRKILAVSGLKDIIAKRHGGRNQLTNVNATLRALKALKTIVA